MLPTLFLSIVIVVTTIIIAGICDRSWGLAASYTVVGSLSGSVMGAAVGAIIDVAAGRGIAVVPLGAGGALLGAVVSTVIASGRWRR